MKCIKIPYSTKQAAEAAKEYHNLQAVTTGWKVMKGVYFCEEHKAWHMTAMNLKEIGCRLNWLKKQDNRGKDFMEHRNKMWDHYMEICQKKLLVPDGRYRKPTLEAHNALMKSLLEKNAKHPIKFKYVEMWWRSLPEESKYNN